MKQFVDQKGNKVNYGDIVHYSESVNEKNFKSFFDVHVTLTPENIDKLKAIGAVKEVELKEKTTHIKEVYQNLKMNLLLWVLKKHLLKT